MRSVTPTRVVVRPLAPARAAGAQRLREPRRGRDRSGRRFAFRLWVPATALAAIASPFVVLASPLIAAGSRRRTNPIIVSRNLLGLMFAMGGTLVEIETPQTSVKIRLI